MGPYDYCLMTAQWRWQGFTTTATTATDQFGQFDYSYSFDVFPPASLQRVITSVSVTAATNTYETGVTPRPPSPYRIGAYLETVGTQNARPWQVFSPSSCALVNNYVSSTGNYGAAWHLWNAHPLAYDAQVRAAASKSPTGKITVALHVTGDPLYGPAPNWQVPPVFQVGFNLTWLTSSPED